LAGPRAVRLLWSRTIERIWIPMTGATTAASGGTALLNLASTIVAAYVSKNSVPPSDLPGVIKNVHGTLCSLSGEQTAGSATSQKPAVPVKKSITPDYIVCLEDGKKLKMLK